MKDPGHGRPLIGDDRPIGPTGPSGNTCATCGRPINWGEYFYASDLLDPKAVSHAIAVDCLDRPDWFSA